MAEMRHLKAKSRLTRSLQRSGDPKVMVAIEKVADKSTHQHTVQSKRYSLLALVKRHIDPVVATWLTENHVVAEWSFSDLVLGKTGASLVALEKIALRGSTDDWFCPDEFSRTCDALIEFLFFTQDHHARHSKVVRVERPEAFDIDEASDRLGWGVKRGVRQKKDGLPIPDYLVSTFRRLRDLELCIACGQQTLESGERQRLLCANIDCAIKESLRDGMQYFSKERGSNLYCATHAKSTGGLAGEKKAQRQRLRFLSLLLAISRKGVVQHVNMLFPASFDLDFAIRAINDQGSRRDMKVIENCLPEHIFSDDINNREAATEKIVATVKKIFFQRLKLTPQPLNAAVGILGNSDQAE